MTKITNHLRNGKRFHQVDVIETEIDSIGYHNIGRAGPSLSFTLAGDDDDPKARNWRITIPETDLTRILARVTQPEYTAMYAFIDGAPNRLNNDPVYRFHQRAMNAAGLFTERYTYQDGPRTWHVVALNVRHAQHQLQRFTKADVPLDAIKECE